MTSFFLYSLCYQPIWEQIPLYFMCSQQISAPQPGHCSPMTTNKTKKQVTAILSRSCFSVFPENTLKIQFHFWFIGDFVCCKIPCCEYQVCYSTTTHLTAFAILISHIKQEAAGSDEQQPQQSPSCFLYTHASFSFI